MEGERGTAKVLADNVKLLRERAPEDKRLGDQALAKAIGAGTGSLRRATGAEDGDVRLETIEKIASFYKVEPWRLLAERLGEGTTVLSPEVAAEAAKIDRIIRVDPGRRTFALMMLQYAQGAPIRTQEQIVDLVVDLSKLLQPT